MGRTMPLVPRMEMPLNAQPWVKGAPRQGLPVGTEITARSPPA